MLLMWTRWRNWKIFSLLLIATVSFAPYVGILAQVWLSKSIIIRKPEKILSSSECSALIGSECLKGMIFKAGPFQKNDLFLPGLTTVAPKAQCLVSYSTKLEVIQPLSIEGTSITFGAGIQKCDWGVLVYFSKDTDPAFSSWIFPWSLQGNYEALSPITRSVQFFRSELRSIVAGIVPFQMVGLYLLLALLGGTIAHRYFYSFLVASLMTVLNGGIVEKTFFLSPTFFSPEFKEFLGLLLLYVFALDTVSEKPKRSRFAVMVVVAVASTTVSNLVHVPKEWFWTIVITGWASIAVISKFSFISTTYFALHSFYLLSVITPINILPQYAGTLFFLIYFLGFQLEQVRLRLLNWRLNQIGRAVSSRERVHSLVKLISKVHKIERITVSVVKDEAFQHWSFSRNRQSPTVLVGDGVSSVVSKVYASGRPIIHLHKEKYPGASLANKGEGYQSSIFSSVPIRNNGSLLGVLSLTDYQNSLMHQDAFNGLGDVFIEVSDIVSKGLGQVSTLFANEFENTFNEALHANHSSSFNTQVRSVMDNLFEKFKVGGYLSAVTSDEKLQLLFATGNHVQILDEVNSYGFKVNSTNEFGPVGLAFKELKPVILESWRPISNKISPKARELYALTGAHSIMTIPLQIQVGNSCFRYLLWLQTGSDRSFNHDFYRVASLMQTRLSHELSKSLNGLVSDSLFSLADTQAIQNVMHGNNSRIVETGELLMFDLAKSTQLSASLGVEEFGRLVDYYTQESVCAMQRIEFKLQMVIGDALIFTRPKDHNALTRTELVKSLYTCERKIRAYIEKAAPAALIETDPSLRVCSVEGDISRDLLKGKGGGWAVVGSTINEVHKIEAIAKKHKGGFYFELANRTCAELIRFHLAEGRPWNGSPDIRYIGYNSIQRQEAA